MLHSYRSEQRVSGMKPSGFLQMECHPNGIVVTCEFMKIVLRVQKL